MTLAEFWARVEQAYQDRANWRYGQSAFNVLARVRPDISEHLRGSFRLDPFHATDRHHPKVIAFREYVEAKW